MVRTPNDGICAPLRRRNPLRAHARRRARLRSCLRVPISPPLPLLTSAALSSPLVVAAPQALLGSHRRTLRRAGRRLTLSVAPLVYDTPPTHLVRLLARRCLRDAARAAPASAPVRLKGFVQATLSTAAPRLHPPSRNAGTVAITLGQFSVEIGAN